MTYRQTADIPAISPVPLITVPGYGTLPAKDAANGQNNRSDPILDGHTHQEVYSAEFGSGQLYERYGGEPVKIARDTVSAQ